MGYYKYVAEAWKKPRRGVHGELYRRRLIDWRRQTVVFGVVKPTRIDKARALGYKAKNGFVVARVRVRRSGLRRARPRAGRRPKRMGIKGFSPHKSLKLIAEERASRRYRNLVVLGSYWVGEDGLYKWYEVVMADPYSPSIRGDPERRWISGYSRGRRKKGSASR